MKMIKTIIFAAKESLTHTKYKFIFISAALLVFFFLVFIPAISIPGNDFFYQLSLFSLLDFSVTIFLSILYALFITMQIYALRHRKRVKDIGTAVGGGVGALFAGVAGTAFCASCLAPLFALFGIGLGAVLFVLQYRFYFVIAIIIFMITAIYFTSKRIIKAC